MKWSLPVMASNVTRNSFWALMLIPGTNQPVRLAGAERTDHRVRGIDLGHVDECRRGVVVGHDEGAGVPSSATDG